VWSQPDVQSATLLAGLVKASPKLLALLHGRRDDLECYRFIMGRAQAGDVRTDEVFQRRFNGLYMVRRGTAWRTAFYELLEAEKGKDVRDFGVILTDLFKRTGRIEASFASKLMATLDDRCPVYDLWVRRNLGLPLRTGPAPARISALVSDYAVIHATYGEIIAAPDFSVLRERFDQILPGYADLSDIKKVDLLFWQTRD
jgi:hypothetical protein